MVMVDVEGGADSLTSFLNIANEEMGVGSPGSLGSMSSASISPIRSNFSATLNASPVLGGGTPLTKASPSPLKPLDPVQAATQAAAAAAEQAAAQAALPKKEPRRRNSFSQMIKSLFVSENKSWRGGDSGSRFDDNNVVAEDQGPVQASKDRKINFADAEKNMGAMRGLDLKNGSIEWGDAPVDVLAAMASIHSGVKGGQGDAGASPPRRSKRERRRSRASF